MYPEKFRYFFNKRNLGITKNCNVALSLCTGDFIAMMGGDDILYKNKIETQLTEFIKNPELVLCYHPCHLMKNGKICGIVGNKKKDIINNFYDMISKYGAYVPGPSAMVRAIAIPKYGFDQSIKTASDWMFYIDVASKGRVKRVNDVLAVYRQHESNVGKQIFSYADDFLLTLKKIELRYPNETVKKNANSAANRFFLGIIYRSIELKDTDAFEKFLKEYKKINKIMVKALKIVYIIPGKSFILKNLKIIIKKYF